MHGRRLLATFTASDPSDAQLEISDSSYDTVAGVCKLPWLSAPRKCRKKITTWTTLKLEGGDDLRVDNVRVLMATGSKQLAITVDGQWGLTASVSAFPFASLNPGQRLLDIEAKALYDADHDEVAPHGIIGQSFDGDDIEVSGKLDARGEAESKTVAQAEGAIEGTWRDYMIRCDPATKPKGAHCEHATEWRCVLPVGSPY